MKPSSSKAKGRRLQNEIVEAIYERFPTLREGDARGAIMGESGADIKLSPAARDLIPLAIEAKNTERLNIWEAIRQAKEHTEEGHPCVVFRRNRHEPWAALPLDVLLGILHRVYMSPTRAVE